MHCAVTLFLTRTPCPFPPRLKEAVKECGSALEVSPGSIKALRHRAKALEKQGMFKAALGDIQVGLVWGGGGCC
jgi:hypothetical protein